MDILEEIKNSEKKIIHLYATIQMQQKVITEQEEKISHLEKLLFYKAKLLQFNKD